MTTAEDAAGQTAISPVRLHGEACIECGRADGPLVPAGHRYTPDGRGRLGWPVKACPEHEEQARQRYIPEELQSGIWVIRDRHHGLIVIDDLDGSPRLYPSRDDAAANLTELLNRGAL